LDGGRHRTQVGADVECIGHQHETDRDKEHPPAVLLANNRGNTLARDQANASAHLLNRDQEREHVERQPELASAEGGASLGIRADARRVVVGRAGDQPRSQDAQPAAHLQQRFWTTARRAQNDGALRHRLWGGDSPCRTSLHRDHNAARNILRLGQAVK
jgi:hypothetical protein